MIAFTLIAYQKQLGSRKLFDLLDLLEIIEYASHSDNKIKAVQMTNCIQEREVIQGADWQTPEPEVTGSNPIQGESF